MGRIRLTAVLVLCAILGASLLVAAAGMVDVRLGLVVAGIFLLAVGLGVDA